METMAEMALGCKLPDPPIPVSTGMGSGSMSVDRHARAQVLDEAPTRHPSMVPIVEVEDVLEPGKSGPEPMRKQRKMRTRLIYIRNQPRRLRQPKRQLSR
jgi:hypothetical protein